MGYRRIVRYVASGTFTNLLGYVVFLAMFFAGISPLVCTVSSFFFTLIASYMAHRKWTFRSNSSHSRDVPRYIMSYLIGLIIAISGMYLLLKIMHPALAQILVIGLASFFIYVSLEIMRFGREEVSDAD